MKILLIGLGLLLVGTTLFAQAPYTGGAGDGYSATGNRFQVGDPIAAPFGVEIGFENGADGPKAVLVLTGLTADVAVFIYDLTGKELTSRSLSARGSHREVFSLSETASAVYLFKISMGKEEPISRKILNPYHRVP